MSKAAVLDASRPDFDPVIQDIVDYVFDYDVLNHRVRERYFVCNAGEHEPGTFKDRHLLKTLPHQLIEGCLIASHTVQAKASFIYVNHEYQEERDNLKKALDQAKERWFIGKNVLGSGIDIDLQVFEGHGSYVAGEETAMLESMQGRPGSSTLSTSHS